MKPTGKGQSLAYVGHAEVTRILGEIDDSWTWEPAGWDNGRPAIHLHPYEISRRDGDPIKGVTATMWGHLTLLGVTRLAVGSVESSKQELDKELVSDFLRNAAMRFGICLALWMKDYDPNVSSLDDARARKSQADHPATIPAKASQSVPSVVSSAGHPLATEAQIRFIQALYKGLGQDSPPGLAEISKGTADIMIKQLKEEKENS